MQLVMQGPKPSSARAPRSLGGAAVGGVGRSARSRAAAAASWARPSRTARATPEGSVKDFIGKEEYELGDLSIEADKRVKDARRLPERSVARARVLLAWAFRQPRLANRSCFPRVGRRRRSVALREANPVCESFSSAAAKMFIMWSVVQT